jgi:hypothetical protein
LNVPRFFLLPVLASFFLEYKRYFPDFNFLIMQEYILFRSYQMQFGPSKICGMIDARYGLFRSVIHLFCFRNSCSWLYQVLWSKYAILSIAFGNSKPSQMSAGILPARIPTFSPHLLTQ